VNRLLKHQLKDVYGGDFDLSTLDSKTLELLKLIEGTYRDEDKEKRLLEHALLRNAKELMQSYNVIDEYSASPDNKKHEEHMLLQQCKDSIEDALIITKIDTVGVVTYANDSFYCATGYHPEDILGKAHSIVRSPSMKKSLFQEMWKTIREKKKWCGILENIKKDGGYYYVDATIFPLLDTKGTIREYITVEHDITEHVKIQKSLDKANRYSQQLFDELEDMVLILNEDEGILKVNQNFLDVFGYKTRDDFNDRHRCICELFVKKEGYLDNGLLDGQNWTQTLFRNPEKDHKAIIPDKNGQHCIYRVRVKKIVFNETSSMIATFTDISELELARAYAENSVAAKAQFMAHMSHEIRTPMNSIMGFTNMLKESRLNGKQTQYAHLIEHSTGILLKLVNDILDFSKIESGNLQLHETNVNPFIELKNSISIFTPEAREKDISFCINIDSRLKECIRMDELRVTQVLSNLINNALKFTPVHGSISVDISPLPMKGNKEVTLFSVKDTGIGIPRQDQKNISLIYASGSQYDP